MRCKGFIFKAGCYLLATVGISFLLVIVMSSYFRIWNLNSSTVISFFSPYTYAAEWGKMMQAGDKSVNSWLTENCTLSRSESDNFFCKPNYMWIERKRIYTFQDKLNMMKASDQIFFRSNWESNFYCSHKVRIGSTGDGGKWVCDPYKFREKKDCLVYSAGSNNEFSLEVEMKKQLPQCSIFTSDQNNFSCPNGICTFHQAVLGSGSSENSKSWVKVTQELKHTKRTVDIFKIDVEGIEYEFFKDMFNSNISSENFPRQILVEIHPANIEEIHRFFELFRKNHYVIFHREPNLGAGPKFFEYAFLRLNADFFRAV